LCFYEAYRLIFFVKKPKTSEKKDNGIFNLEKNCCLICQFWGQSTLGNHSSENVLRLTKRLNSLYDKNVIFLLLKIEKKIKMVEEYDEFYFNVTTLCGKQNFIFWDDALNDFGECFISLFLVNIFIKFHIKPTTVCSNSSHSCLFQAYNLV